MPPKSSPPPVGSRICRPGPGDGGRIDRLAWGVRGAYACRPPLLLVLFVRDKTKRPVIAVGEQAVENSRVKDAARLIPPGQGACDQLKQRARCRVGLPRRPVAARQLAVGRNRLNLASSRMKSCSAAASACSARC